MRATRTEQHSLHYGGEADTELTWEAKMRDDDPQPPIFHPYSTNERRR